MPSSAGMKTTIGNYASYIYIKEWDESFKPLVTKELANGVYLDYNSSGELVGIEIEAQLDPEYNLVYQEE